MHSRPDSVAGPLLRLLSAWLVRGKGAQKSPYGWIGVKDNLEVPL